MCSTEISNAVSEQRISLSGGRGALTLEVSQESNLRREKCKKRIHHCVMASRVMGAIGAEPTEPDKAHVEELDYIDW